MTTYRSVFVLLALAVACQTCLAGGPATDDLREGFRDPPLSARPAVYWVWLNGLTDKDQMTWELEEMKAKGIGGVYIFDVGAQDPQEIVPAGPAFMGPESLDAIGHAVREATRLGLEVGLVTSSSWNCGGPWVPPKHASMGLYHRQVTVTGPQRFSDVLPMPALPRKAPRNSAGEPAYVKDVAVLAVPAPRRLPGHEFVFELAPPGTHTIDRVVLYNTTSGDEERYGEMHLFTKDFTVSVSTTTADADAFEPVVHGTLTPKTEAQTFTFEPRRARFVKLVVRSGHNSEFDRVQLGEFEVYSTQGQNVACAYHADGSKTAAALLHYSDALGTETERNWTAGNIHDGSKSGPGGSWCSAGLPPLVVDDPDAIVNLTDRIDETGRLHWDVPAGTWMIMRFVCANTGLSLRLPSPNSGGLAIDHFSSKATAHHFRVLLDRLGRELGDFGDTALKQMYVCSYELSGSTWTPDFLDQFQRRRGYDMTDYLPVLAGCVVKGPEVTARFDYDYRKTLGDLLVDAFYKTSYELLVLPEREDIDLEVLRKIEQLVKAGATVVGPRPTRSNGLMDYARRDAKVREIADRLWGSCDGKTRKENVYGRGEIIWGRTLREILKERGIGPDASFGFPVGEPGEIDYIHRRTDSADVYFVSNQEERWIDVTCRFRVKGRTPELWLPDTGQIRRWERSKSLDDSSQVFLRLPPFGSAFVVFRETADRQATTASAGQYVLVSDAWHEIAGPWELRFPDGWGAPASVTLPELVSWTQVPEEGVQYFSGMATYRKEFVWDLNECDASHRLLLDLGRVGLMAEVYVDGVSCGIVWKPPFQVDVTDAIRPGANTLVVEVANTWSNRLVGDARTEGKDYCRTNITRSLTWRVPWKETPLLESGLLGPVKLISSPR